MMYFDCDGSDVSAPAAWIPPAQHSWLQAPVPAAQCALPPAPPATMHGPLLPWLPAAAAPLAASWSGAPPAVCTHHVIIVFNHRAAAAAGALKETKRHAPQQQMHAATPQHACNTVNWIKQAPWSACTPVLAAPCPPRRAAGLPAVSPAPYQAHPCPASWSAPLCASPPPALASPGSEPPTVHRISGWEGVGMRWALKSTAGCSPQLPFDLLAAAFSPLHTAFVGMVGLIGMCGITDVCTGPEEGGGGGARGMSAADAAADMRCCCLAAAMLASSPAAGCEQPSAFPAPGRWPVPRLLHCLPAAAQKTAGQLGPGRGAFPCLRPPQLSHSQSMRPCLKPGHNTPLSHVPHLQHYKLARHLA